MSISKQMNSEQTALGYQYVYNQSYEVNASFDIGAIWDGKTRTIKLNIQFASEPHTTP